MLLKFNNSVVQFEMVYMCDFYSHANFHFFHRQFIFFI